MNLGRIISEYMTIFAGSSTLNLFRACPEGCNSVCFFSGSVTGISISGSGTDNGTDIFVLCSGICRDRIPVRCGDAGSSTGNRLPGSGTLRFLAAFFLPSMIKEKILPTIASSIQITSPSIISHILLFANIGIFTCNTSMPTLYLSLFGT